MTSITRVVYAVCAIFDTKRKQLTTSYIVVEAVYTAAGTYMAETGPLAEKPTQDYQDARLLARDMMMDPPDYAEEVGFIPRMMIIEDRALTWSTPEHPDWETTGWVDGQWALYEQKEDIDIGD